MTIAGNIRVVISGGGTGGHVFPAIAIAHALKKIDPGIELLFVGAKGRMEMEKVPEAGYKIEGLWISGFQRSLSFQNLMFPFKLISSIYKSNRIISQFKPDAAVGVGGYASGPLGYVAAGKKIPLVLQEQNSYPGITNKLLANKASTICVAYDGMERFFPKDKIVKTGNPVRNEIVNMTTKAAEGNAFFGLDPSRKTILVIGGSLGSRTINETMATGFEALAKAGYQLIWQTGKFYYNSLQNLNSGNKGQVKIMPFIKEMDQAYAAADIIISRAGAIAISELCIVGKPVVLVPSPNVAEDHQTKNALALTQKNAAIMVKDTDARERLIPVILELANNEQELKDLAANISKLAISDAADRIAQEIFKLIRK